MFKIMEFFIIMLSTWLYMKVDILLTSESTYVTASFQQKGRFEPIALI